jgi:hypothetical protein
MNRNHISHRTSAERISPQFLKSGNSLGIVHTESYWDKNRKQIVYLIKTNQIVSREIDVRLKDNFIQLEAPLFSSLVKPFTQVKAGKEMGSKLKEGYTGIGYSELRLKSGYHYTLISSQLINPNLIKVVLGFKPEVVCS